MNNNVGNWVNLEGWAFLLRFNAKEINQIGEILVKHKISGDADLENLTQDEADFLEKMFSRPILPPPQIIKGVERRQICGRQPAFERDGSFPFCDDCYKEMIGRADEFFKEYPSGTSF